MTMKLWHAETVSGTASDLASTLQRIEDADGSIMGMTAVASTFGPSCTYQRDVPSENER